MTEYTFRDSDGLFTLWMDRSEFDAFRDFVVSPRTEELCQAIPQPFIGRVKSGGYRSGRAHAGYVIESQKTLGSHAEKNSRPDYVAEAQAKEKEENYQAKVRRWEHFERALGQPLPKPVKEYKPWFRKEDKVDLSLNKMTQEEKTTYILEGKKPLSLDKRGKEPK